MGNEVIKEVDKNLAEKGVEKPDSPNRKLAKELNKKLLTLMIIGKCGSGKSTWINTFINFLAGKTYRDPRLVAISQTFGNLKQVCNIPEFKEYQVERVSCQSDAQTLTCTMYRVITEDYLISISDTPGLDESVFQDASHVKNIAEHADLLSEIDAIVYIHNDSEKRATGSLKQMIDKYFEMLTPEVISQKLVVCFTHMSNVYDQPQSLDALKKLKIMTDFPETKWFHFKNDNFLDHKVAEDLKKTTLDERSRKRYSDSKSDDWEHNMSSFKAFLDAVTAMKDPASTQDMFIKSKSREAAEDFIKYTLKNFESNKQILAQIRANKAHLSQLLELLNGKDSNKLVLGYPEDGIFHDLFGIAKTNIPVVYCKPKRIQCKNVSKDDISLGWFSTNSDDKILKCCGAKKSQHEAIYYKLQSRIRRDTNVGTVKDSDPCLLALKMLDIPGGVQDEYTKLVVIHLKLRHQAEDIREKNLLSLIQTLIRDGKSLDAIRNPEVEKSFNSLIRAQDPGLFSELQTEFESKELHLLSPGCIACLSTFALKERLSRSGELERKFAACKPYHIAKAGRVMQEGGK